MRLWYKPQQNQGTHQAALDAIKKLEKPAPTAQHLSAIFDCEDTIKALTSAEPDIPGINVIIDTIKNAINASTGNEAYMVGLRNGMRWCWSALTDKEPEYEDMPSAQPRWIPVTERLPEYFVPVLTWDGQNQCVEMRIPYVITTEGETIKSDWWCDDYWEDKEESLYNPQDLRDGAALAWMPLPKPWRGGQDGN